VQARPIDDAPLQEIDEGVALSRLVAASAETQGKDCERNQRCRSPQLPEHAPIGRAAAPSI
jgi:hypothetical protein